MDICIYGATSGGIISAIEATERGLSVALLHPGWQIGGLTTGGLGMTDVGNKDAIGGKAREFYERVGHHYGEPVEWRFEPHVASMVFDQWLMRAGVKPRLGQYLDHCSLNGGNIRSLMTLSGLTVEAKVFVDASYEGDLMAMAGVSYTVGREGNDVYGESINGAQIRREHQFQSPVDPYVKPGDPSSGLLTGIETDSAYEEGAGDARIQAYNFRLCLTRRKDIRMSFPKPADYQPDYYILLKRYLATGWNEVFEKFDPIRNGKTDTNNHGAVSTDFIGANHAYPEADYEERENIFQNHVSYQQGLMWCLANDLDVPAPIREAMSEWGLCRDEFQPTGGWPHALYIREARRMVSEVVMHEGHCLGREVVEDPIALGAYNMDSHNCRRLIHDGRLWNEGDVQVGVPQPYGIAYRSIVPAEGECANLIVPFCLSASHVAFGSIRMEPVFMGLGQVSAIAAALSIQDGVSVQQIEYSRLRTQLEKAHLVTQYRENCTTI